MIIVSELSMINMLRICIGVSGLVRKRVVSIDVRIGMVNVEVFLI